MGLAEHAAARDEATFVARTAELAVLEALVAPTSERLVAVVTGSAGMGKSALVREASRRAARQGYDVVWFDARERVAGRTVVDAVEEAEATVRPLLVVDSAEELGAEEGWLRERGLAMLPDTARVVLASRQPLEPAWWGSAWSATLVSLPVGPLVAEAASAFLAARALPVGPESDSVVAWAEGHPLSLTLAAAVRGARGAAVDAGELAGLETDLLDLLTGGRLAGSELVGEDRLVLAVAALAPAVDAALLEAVLGPGTGESAERWLRSLPFAERLGHRVTLHQRVRRLLAARLREAEPDVERTLRLRIIDHLSGSSATAQLVLEVREVLAPPQDRGVTPSRALASPWRVTTAVVDDGPRAAALLRGQDPSYVAWVRRWVTAAPEHVVAVRHPHDDRLAALAVWATDEQLPAVLTDPVAAAWVDAARSWRGGTLLNPVTELDPDLARVDVDEVSALLLASMVRRCGLDDFRRWVVPRKPPAPDPSHCGGVATPALDLVLGGVRLATHVIDYGPGGAIGAMHDEARSVAAPAPPALPSRAITADDVRDALRACHDPVRLARSPLAQGGDPAARAASVLALLRSGLADAFGETDDGRLQRDVLQRGYLDADASHTRAMHTLHLSRTTYFRRLREATATLATWLDETRG